MDTKNQNKSLMFLLIAIAWGAFAFSSLQYQHVFWFNYLFLSRLFAFSVSVVLMVLSILKVRMSRNFLTTLLAFSALVQASHGVLEGAESSDFQSYVGLICILLSVSYAGPWRIFREKWIPFIYFVCLSPFFFKGAAIVGSAGNFIDKNSLVVFTVILAPLIGRLNASRYELFQEKLILERKLQDELTERQQKIEQQAKALSQAKLHEAVAQVTQMLAHDVRKPFSLFETGIAILKDIRNQDDLDEVLGLLIPEVERTVCSVKGLIADVLEIGGVSSQLVCESVSPEDLVKAVLYESRMIYPKSLVNVDTYFSHSRPVLAHPQKIQRVFSNIVCNAFEAINFSGSMWIKTAEQDAFIQFCIGNEGSYISPENCSLIFESFFTSGKKAGTGLGLAIAKKIVEAHGGKIRCESELSDDFPTGKTEFIFSLPVAGLTVAKNLSAELQSAYL